MELEEWILEYLKHKDIFTRSIKEIEKKDDHIVIHYKDRDVRLVIQENLDPAVTDHEIIVTLNRRSNLDVLIKNWSKFAKKKDLTLYFVNLKSQEKKWIIRPHLHDKIADDDTLSEGLNSMFSTVDEA